MPYPKWYGGLWKRGRVSTPNVQPTPRPEVRFVGLGDSSLNFRTAALD